MGAGRKLGGIAFGFIIAFRGSFLDTFPVGIEVRFPAANAAAVATGNYRDFFILIIFNFAKRDGSKSRGRAYLLAGAAIARAIRAGFAPVARIVAAITARTDTKICRSITNKCHRATGSVIFPATKLSGIATKAILPTITGITVSARFA